MTHFANSITEINTSGFVIIMLILIVVTVGVIRFIISHKKLKFNLSLTFLVVSMLSLGLLLTSPGEAKVKESQNGEKESGTRARFKPTMGSSKSTGSKSTGGSQSTDSKSTDSSKSNK